MAPNAGVSVTPDVLRDKYSEIIEIDGVLDAAAGSRSAGKRAIANQVVQENTSLWEKPVSQVIEKFLSGLENEQLVAAYSALTSQMEERFGETVDKWLEAEADTRKTDAPKMSEEQLASLSETRKTKVAEYNALRNILEMFGQDVSDIPEPKTRRGGRGKRGPRLLSQFQYTVNDIDLTEDNNSLATVATLGGFEKVSELKDFLKTNGVDPAKPADDWPAITLPNGAVLTASRFDAYRGTDEEEEEETAEASA